MRFAALLWKQAIYIDDGEMHSREVTGDFCRVASLFVLTERNIQNLTRYIIEYSGKGLLT